MSWVTPVDSVPAGLAPAVEAREVVGHPRTLKPSTAILPIANLTATGCEVRQGWNRGLCVRRLEYLQPIHLAWTTV